MAIRMGDILPRIISMNQTGFVKGRSITDNVMLAQEMLHLIDKKNRGNNVAIKLDMAKAYDRVSWLFLIKILKAFGFNNQIIDMVWRSISNCFYSIRINGNISGFFKSSRGLKQGDPLSPALFIIAAELFSRGIQQKMENNVIQSFSQPLGTEKLSHLGFADDVLIFSNGSKKSLKELMEFLKHYQYVSGQLLNAHKCTFITSKKVQARFIRSIKEITGFSKQEIPMTYLGCPIFPGRAKNAYFQDLVSNIKNKVKGWQYNLLNQAGRLVLILHVLQSMPIHLCSAIAPPASILKDIDRIFNQCFWGESEGVKKHHWVNWVKCCSPKNEGGLGLKNLKDILKVQAYKQYWKLVSEDTLWSKFMKQKYKRDIEDPNHVSYSASTIWKRIKSIRWEADSYIFRSDHTISWKLSKDGRFNTKCTWEEIRNRNEECSNFKYIWNKYIPKKISVMMWRLVQNRLPFDKNLQQIGINLASKCVCCKNPQIESMNHVFFSSDSAKVTWNYFVNRLGLRVISHTFNTFLRSWWYRLKNRNDDGAIIFLGLPSIICWCLWKARNRKVFDGEEVNCNRIIDEVKKMIKDIEVVVGGVDSSVTKIRMEDILS